MGIQTNVPVVPIDEAAFSAGGVMFGDSAGVPTSNQGSFFWDNVNLRLNLGGGAEPTVRLGSQAAPFVCGQIGHTTFNGVQDDAMAIGYNILDNFSSTRIDTSKARSGIAFEANFYDGVNHFSEINSDWVAPAGGATVRGFNFQYRYDGLQFFEFRLGGTMNWWDTTRANEILRIDNTGLLQLFKVGANDPTFYIWNVDDPNGTGNYERAAAYWHSNTLKIETQAGGTGTGRDIQISTVVAGNIFFSTSGTQRWQMTSGNGNWISVSDNGSDVGGGSNRARSVYLGTTLFVGTTPATSGQIALPDMGAINWRNHANSGDLTGIAKNASDQIYVGGNANIQILIGGVSSAQLAFFAGTPAGQQTPAGNTTYADAGAAVVHTAGTFTGGIGATGYTIGDIVAVLKTHNLFKN